MPTEIVNVVLDKISGSKIWKEKRLGAMIYRWPMRRGFYFLSLAYTLSYEATGALTLATLHCLIYFREEHCQASIALNNCQQWLGDDLQTSPVLRSALRSKARRGRSQLLAGSISARQEAIMRQRRTKTHLALQLSTTRHWDTLLALSLLPCWTSQWWSALVSTPRVSVTQPMHMQKCQLIW